MIPDPSRLRERLQGEGLSAGAADDAVRRLLRAAAWSESDSGPAGAGFFVPGRIELLGKHTDYAGGRSLVTALEAGISAVVFAHDEPWIEAIDTDTGARIRFDLQEEIETDPDDPGTWTTYPATYLRRIRADLPRLGCSMEGGARVAWSSSLPRAAGMSSSSTLLVTLHLALATRYGWARADEYRALLPDRESLSGYLAAVEAGRPHEELTGGDDCRGVGSDGGSQDHTAILASRAGHVVQFAFRPTRFEGQVPLPAGWIFALASSGVRSPKSGSARERYNRLAAQTGAIMDLWLSEHQGSGEGDGDRAPESAVEHPGAILELGPGALVQLGRILRESRHLRFSPEVLLARAEQFVDEAGLHVPAAFRALEEGEIEVFARSVEASHRAAVGALGNDTPETEALTLEARALGAAAASPFGAGFGGSVWAMVREDESADFLDRWRRSYLEAFPERQEDAVFLRSRAGPPALRVF